MSHDHVARLWALRSLLGIEGDFVTLVEGPEAVGLDGREVNEHVFATLFLRDEPVTLLAAEPLDLACRHDLPFRPERASGGNRDCLVAESVTAAAEPGRVADEPTCPDEGSVGDSNGG